MKFNIYLKALLLGFTIIFIASCDKDYNEIGADVIGDNDNHYGFDVDSTKTVKAYNLAIGPVQTNNLPINALGSYNHPKFGRTTANFVTQLELVAADPKFYSPTIDSVYLYVPYFSELTETDSETGDRTFELDSVYGGTAKFRLSVYESGYFLRDYDPADGFQEAQKYYSNQNAIFDANKIGTPLNNDVLSVSQNEEFYFKTNEYKIKYQKDGEEVIKERKAPGIWLDLDEDFFAQKIFNAPSGKLINNNVFKDYFRGLYFKAEELPSSPIGAMAMLNFKQGKIVIEYEDETSSTDDTRKKKSMSINLGGNSVNLFENAESPEFSAALATANPSIGDEKLYLKGQQGSIAVIDLFGSEDLKGVDPNTGLLNNTPNGISDEIDEMKVNNWLINEANLTFTIDNTSMASSEEPYRIYLYDLNNRRPIYDYYTDFSTRANTKFNKVVHGGIIDTQKIVGGRGIRYKIRLTNHVRNLIKNDSTNVRLGLAITESISTVSNVKLKTPITSGSSSIDRIPTAAVMNPLGTILYGNRSSVPEGKKLKLKIYYTKPD
ncbi:DUF4270 domain-containing protein [Flavobacterium sp.]|uniref:DUF4270 domain-containing protein n=1 Tax=Flavobacterium sp. TaxID=239 RepID=UPI00260ABD35|nr:DUF4270 domain-containing protein [Flavobacterium sp.]